MDDYKDLDRDYVTELHVRAREQTHVELLPLRLRALAGALLGTYVPKEVRVHIVAALTHLVSLHDKIHPGHAARELAVLKGLLLGDVMEYGPTKALQGDDYVQTAYVTANQHYERTLASLQKREAEEAKKREEEKSKVPDNLIIFPWDNTTKK